MKVFLMHPDRDLKQEPELLPNAQDLVQDLELNTLFQAMAQGDTFIYEVVQHAILSSLNTTAAIRYRQEILKDCLKHPDIVRQIYRIPIQVMQNKQNKWFGIFTRYPTGILINALEMLEMLTGYQRELRTIADNWGEQFESPGFQRFFAMIRRELDDAYFAAVEQHLDALRFRRGVLFSAELGRGNEGTDYILCRNSDEDQSWIQRAIGPKSPAYSYTLHPRDNHGARALADLKDRGLNVVANAVAQSADHIDSFFTTLRQELAFYMGCLKLSERLAQLGEPVAFPLPAPANPRRLASAGLYDITLALTMNSQVVGNDLRADDKDLLMITGANQGGKSTFLRSVGLAQLMMQCGLFVPARSFSASIAGGLFTHYKREEDAAMKSGKLDEELARMSRIIDQITPDSIVLFNESFSSTNEREGSEIARQIIRALLEKRIKVFFVTHSYELANAFYGDGMANALFLRAERKPGGERTFRLIEGEPLQTSHGPDIYEQVFGTRTSRSQGEERLAWEAG